jgi:hypothetical protein
VRALVNEGGWGADVLGNLGSRLTGGSATGTFLSSGARLVSNLFGNKTDGLTDIFASGTGVQRGSASTILCLAAPIVMSVIGKQIAARGLSASGLSTMLAGERSSLLGALPTGVTGLLGMADPARPAARIPETLTETLPAGEPLVRERLDREPILDREPLAERSGANITRWWPALLIGLAAVAMLFLLTRGRQAAYPREGAGRQEPRKRRSETRSGGGGPLRRAAAGRAGRSASCGEASRVGRRTGFGSRSLTAAPAVPPLGAPALEGALWPPFMRDRN